MKRTLWNASSGVPTILLVSALISLLSTIGAAGQLPLSAATPGTRVVTQESSVSQSQNNENRQREIEIQERISNLTRLLVIVGAIIGTLQIGVMVAQAVIYRAQLRATYTVERAYVDISHHPPGLRFQADGTPIAVFAVRNYGRTPADILNVSVTLRTGNDPLPDIPPYGMDNEVTQAFVMPNESINVAGNFQPVTQPTVAALHNGTLTAWLLGYVDYVDRFGRRHRGGYARRYVPTLANNNLVFETTPGYNYDIDL